MTSRALRNAARGKGVYAPDGHLGRNAVGPVRRWSRAFRSSARECLLVDSERLLVDSRGGELGFDPPAADPAH